MASETPSLHVSKLKYLINETRYRETCIARHSSEPGTANSHPQEFFKINFHCHEFCLPQKNMYFNNNYKKYSFLLFVTLTHSILEYLSYFRCSVLDTLPQVYSPKRYTCQFGLGKLNESLCSTLNIVTC